jgi:hypothetical protein
MIRTAQVGQKGGEISFLPNKATKCHVSNDGFADGPVRTPLGQRLPAGNVTTKQFEENLAQCKSLSRMRWG